MTWSGHWESRTRLVRRHAVCQGDMEAIPSRPRDQFSSQRNLDAMLEIVPVIALATTNPYRVALRIRLTLS